eukprot:TRINITY_DN14585_c0_g1_i1.p1 TRINITY_DN14585_c0_g1~~TRINITY_DN14585_c0_g1_i1.p1  ORF type:complete len:371 (-),score=44.12 TRINITY_DN14585_c0_g1_i1:65-1177(-)
MDCGGWCIKQKKKWKTMGIWSKAFCLVALSNYLTLIGFTMFSMVLHGEMGHISSLTLRAIFFVITGFQAAHSWFGMMHDNIYELGATMLSQVFVSIYLVGILIQAPRPWGSYHYIMFCYGVLYFVLYCAFLYPLHKEYSWNFFAKAGADPAFRRKYRRFLRFQAMIKIQLMGLIVNCLVIGAIPLHFNLSWFLTFDFVLVSVAILMYALGRNGFQKEKHHYVYPFWTLQLIIPAYLTYFFMIGQGIFDRRMAKPNITEDEYSLFVGYLWLFYGSGTLLFLVQSLVIVTSVMLFRYFGQGIKDIRKHLKKEREAATGLVQNDTNLVTSDSGEDVTQTEEMFQEIFQTTLEKAHHVGSYEDRRGLLDWHTVN